MLPRWYACKTFWRDVRPGQTIEVSARAQTTFATVLAYDRGRMVAKPDSLTLEPGPVSLRMPLPGALVRASARIIEVVGGPLATVTLDRFEHVEKCERRRYPRLYEPVAVRLHSLTTDAPDRTLAATNISGKGLLLGWPGVPEMVLGERLEMTICLENGECVPIVGEVVRIERYRSAVRFVNVAPTGLDTLVGYVFRRDAAHRVEGGGV